MDLSDQEDLKRLVKGCAKGDEKYQQYLYKHMYSPMMAVCYRYASRPEDAKDLFQEGFIKVFDKINRFNFKGSLEGWIRRIMVNHAIDHFRRQKNKYAMSETLLVAENIAAEETSETLYGDLEANELLELVQALSPTYRTVFNMFILDGYTHNEIADELDISVGTSKSNLSKAKQRLKYMISEKMKLNR